MSQSGSKMTANKLRFRLFDLFNVPRLVNKFISPPSFVLKNIQIEFFPRCLPNREVARFVASVQQDA